MKITPLEIRQHTFDKKFRGYDVESVDVFLLSLSQEWERVSDEIKYLKAQLQMNQKEIARIKEIEDSLFKTLKVAEDNQKNINSMAEKEAYTFLENAKAEAYKIKTEAEREASMLLSDAHVKAQYIIQESQQEIRALERNFKGMERYKELLTSNLRKLSKDTLTKVAIFEEQFAQNKFYKISNNKEVVKENLEIEAKQEEIQLPKPEDTSASFEALSVALANEIKEEEKEKVREDSFVLEEKEEAFLPPSSKTVNKGGRPRKIRAEDVRIDNGLPTVFSVMEEINKGNLQVTGNNSSFFDDI